MREAIIHKRDDLNWLWKDLIKLFASSILIHVEFYHFQYFVQTFLIMDKLWDVKSFVAKHSHKQIPDSWIILNNLSFCCLDFSLLIFNLFLNLAQFVINW